ncbi:MAG: ABC transporter substrate-binding protein [Phycisphaerales bacterium]
MRSCGTTVDGVDRVRRALSTLALASGVLVLTACGGGSDEPAPATDQTDSAPTREVIVYTNASPPVARAVADAFEVRSGIGVVIVSPEQRPGGGDLVQRIIREAEAPRGDVWWSIEPYDTIALEDAGALQAFTASAAETDFGGSWPTTARAADGTWYAAGQQARVIAYDTRELDPEAVPRTLRDLAEPEWTGQVGLARPISGPSLAHLAALVHLWGPGPTASWLSAMEANGLRLYASDDEVVRAIADGEIELGLTGSAAVRRASARGMPVAMVYETNEVPTGYATPDTVMPLMGFGPLAIPTTVAVVAGAPNPDAAAEFVEFLLSEQGERLLMGGEAMLVPIRLELRDELASEEPMALIPNPAEPAPEAIAEAMDQARGLAREVLGL